MQLNFTEAKVTDLHQLSVYRMAVTCAPASGEEEEDVKIFLMSRTLVPGGPGDYEDKFRDVCAPDDLDRYPADEPAVDQEFPFYRTDSFELDFPSLTQYEAAKDAITERAKMLRRMQVKLETLGNPSSVDIDS